jgi:hypothetical protein
MFGKLNLGLLAAVVLACGCGGETESGPPDGPPNCTENGSVCALIHVPAGFDAKPRQLAAGFYETLPVTGPPEFMADLIDNPEISGTRPLSFVVHDCLKKPAEYYLYFVLYMQGGGTWIPSVGVDYIAHTESKMFGDGPVNLGDITLMLAVDQ